MAGGSRIVISDEGITISTGGQILYKAQQHKFESGERVISPQFNLPTLKTNYSNKIDYSWDNSLQNKKEIIILNENNQNVIHTKVDQLNNNSISSSRFYTEHEMDFIALGFNSSSVGVNQDIPDSDNFDELLEDALFDNSFDDDDTYVVEVNK